MRYITQGLVTFCDRHLHRIRPDFFRSRSEILLCSLDHQWTSARRSPNEAATGKIFLTPPRPCMQILLGKGWAFLRCYILHLSNGLLGFFPLSDHGQKNMLKTRLVFCGSYSPPIHHYTSWCSQPCTIPPSVSCYFPAAWQATSCSSLSSCLPLKAYNIAV